MSPEPRDNNHRTESRNTSSFPASNRKILFFSAVAVIAAVLFALLSRDPTILSPFRRVFGSSSRAARSTVSGLSTSASIAAAATAKSKDNSKAAGFSSEVPKMKTPVYFFSHGGVSISRHLVDYAGLMIHPSLISCSTRTILPTASWARSGVRLRRR